MRNLFEKTRFLSVIADVAAKEMEKMGNTIYAYSWKGASYKPIASKESKYFFLDSGPDSYIYRRFHEFDEEKGMCGVNLAGCVIAGIYKVDYKQSINAASCDFEMIEVCEKLGIDNNVRARLRAVTQIQEWMFNEAAKQHPDFHEIYEGVKGSVYRSFCVGKFYQELVDKIIPSMIECEIKAGLRIKAVT